MKTVILVLAAFRAFGQGMPMPGPGTPAPAVSGRGGGGTCTPVTGYAHCRVLTINHTQVGGTLMNFPVLVSTTLGSFRIQSSNCYDVVFTSDSGGTAKIPWEQETCFGSTGAIVDWVGVSSISGSVDTNIYVSYDNASISTAQNTGPLAPTNVWDANYKSVWHLSNGLAPLIADSTSTGNTLNNVGSVGSTAGQIGDAASLNGSNHLDGSNIASIGGAAQFTLSFWVNPIATPNYAVFMQQWPSSFYLEAISGGTGLSFGFSGGQAYETAGSLAIGTWAQYALVYDGTAPSVTLYRNGVAVPLTLSGTIPSALGASGAQFLIASLDAARLTAALDEVEVSTGIARTAAWVAAQYANQKTSSTFLTIGSEI